ncbi:hypothetical protein HYH03_013853 [Edaphochlamys debaryana]|uniref:Uncharacterized protein n=1 Tax=Edaphochlamys debaryana TaxID=47281 RepID=A0A835XPZ2_9CHLO|nr:hypothetical protein HYH03_013853 [Edaphochlamys debaryana]|eukprot:KAG2487574.1 hypothetical protein HYH03_013853 [Edaphochlamys debaryana]
MASKKPLARVLATFGTASDGRLGLGFPIARELYPRIVACLAGYSVQQVSCGGAHTAVVTDDGTLLTFGADRQGAAGAEQVVVMGGAGALGAAWAGAGQGAGTRRGHKVLHKALSRQYGRRTRPAPGPAGAGPFAGPAADEGSGVEEPLPRFLEWHEGLCLTKDGRKLWEAYKGAMRSAAAAGLDPEAAAERLLERELGPAASRQLYRTLFRLEADPRDVVAGG